MSSQSGSEMLGSNEEVSLNQTTIYKLYNLASAINSEDEEVITLSDDEEVDYDPGQNQYYQNELQNTNSQKRQREPNDEDNNDSSIDQSNSNLSKKSRCADDYCIYGHRGTCLRTECVQLNDASKSFEEDYDSDCMIVYLEEKDQQSTSTLASYSTNFIEETTQKSFDSLSIAEEKFNRYQAMLSTLRHQLNAMVPDSKTEKTISCISISDENALSCKLINLEANVKQLIINLQEKEVEISALNSQLDNIKRMEPSIQSTDVCDRSQLSELEEKINQYEAIIKELSTNHQLMKEENCTMETQLREFSCGIQDKEDRILSLENELNECQVEKQEKNDKCNSMKIKMDKLSNQFQEQHGMIFSLSKQMEALHDQLKEKNQEILKLTNRIEDRDKVIASMEDPSSDAFSRSVEFLKLKERANDFEEKYSNLTVTMTVVIKEKNDHIESLKTTVAAQKITIESLETQREELKKLQSGFNSFTDLVNTVQAFQASLVAAKIEQDNAQVASTSIGTNQSTAIRSKVDGPLAIVDKEDLIPNAEGVFEKKFPLNKQVLLEFKNECGAAKFVHKVMEYVFTRDYLCKNTYSKMDINHREQIIDAALNMYDSFTNPRDNVKQKLIRDKVVEFMKQKFSSSKQSVKNENASLRGNQSRRSK